MSTSNKKKLLIILGPVVIITSSIIYYTLSSRYIITDNAYVKTNIIAVTPQVSGIVSEVHIKDNLAVLKDSPLFEIEKIEYQTAVNKAQAELDEVANKIESMRADYKSIEAKYQQAVENASYLERESTRYKSLMSQNAASTQRSDQATHDYYAATKELDNLKYTMQIKKALLDNDPDIKIEDHSSYRKSSANLEGASLNLSRTSVISPSGGVITSGTVTNGFIRPGMYVTSGMPVLNLVEDDNIWVEANFKETDLTYMQVNQHTNIEIDSFKGEKWQAVVESITPATGSEFSILPAQNSSGNWVKVVQRVKVRLRIVDNKNKAKLRSGMSAYVKIDTANYHIF